MRPLIALPLLAACSFGEPAATDAPRRPLIEHSTPAPLRPPIEFCLEITEKVRAELTETCLQSHMRAQCTGENPEATLAEQRALTTGQLRAYDAYCIDKIGSYRTFRPEAEFTRAKVISSDNDRICVEAWTIENEGKLPNCSFYSY